MIEEKQGSEEKLIADLVGRANAQVKLQKASSGYQTAEQLSLEQIRKKNEETLIELSANKLNVIISGLAEGLDALSKNKSKDDSPEKILKYQAAIVDLMAKCMAHSWDHIKGQFRSVQGLDEKEAIRLKEKEEQILPPPLEETLAKFILVQVMQLLLRPEPELHDTAGRLLFQLSATNYESVFSKIAEAIHAIVNNKDTDDTTSAFTLIECLNLNSRRLSELLERINKNAAHFKKDKQQNILSQVLRKAIWNWIDNYPMEFVSLCQSGSRLAGAPDALFDVLDGWSKKNKNNFWPLQTMLLVLTPDIMLKISLNKDKGPEIAAKEKFLETIKKALKTPKTAEMAAVCCVDLCKASTFVSKQDVSALRYLVPAIETDLKDKLFNIQVPFRKGGGDSGAIDVDLMTDSLVASFRIAPRKALNSLFPECVHQDAPPHFKMVLVKGLLRIAKEDKSGANLPWNPSITDVYPTLSGPLKTLFQDYVQGVKTYNTIKNATDKKTKQQAEKLAYDIQILALLIELFDVDANFILFPLKTPAQDLEDVRSVMVGLCYCASLFSMPELSDIAPRALLGLHLPGNIEKWSSKSAINGFWEISSSVNVTLANGLIDQRDIKPDQIQKLVTLLESILIRRNNFLDRFKENHRPEPQLKDVRFQGSTKLEVALLIHLCSAEPDICSKCATCFGLLCDEVDIFGEADEGNSIVANYSVYRKLSTTGIFQVGRQHQQKGIRMLLRRVDTPTTGNFAAWEDVYYRWKTATESFLTPEEDKTKRATPFSSTPFSSAPAPPVQKTAGEIQQWQNYLGFLVGLSGVTLNRETTVKITEDPKKSRNKGSVSTEKTVKLTDSFIIELLELLVCDNALVRETVMSLTGTSLSPASYAVLFRNLQDEVQGLFGDAGQVDFSERSILFVDQAVSIVKHILESPQQSEDLSLVTSFESLILLFVKFVSQLLGSSSSLRIKKNMCSLLENMMAQRQNISFKHEYDFRNTLVEAVVEWTTDFAIKGASPSPAAEQPLTNANSEKGLADSPAAKEALLAKKLQKELDVACIASVALLLRGLPLPAETQQVKFMKYFSFFTTLLTRCKQDADSPAALAENAIKALSNLLSANIQAGLEYFVTMGYHDDHDTRSAFLKVISNILAQGTEFDQLDEGEKYDKLLELLIEPEMSVVLALGESTQITEADEVAHLLVRLFESNDRGLSMVKMVVTAEVNITETANTLFRRNSVATKVLSSYTRLIGPNYLKDTLLPVLAEIMETPNTSYEIAPDTLLPGEDVAKNKQNLVGLAKLFLTAIAKSSTKLPLQLHEICNFMYKVVGERYRGNERIAVGGFMFLRFLCPAIVAPEAYGLVGAGVLSKETRRGLVLVTKLLQHLANGMTSFREPYMNGLELFVTENQKTIEEICDKFAVIPADSTPGKSVHISHEQQEDDLILLHHHISMNLEKITKILEASNRETAERLANVLQKLGPPPEQPKKNTAPTIRGHTGGGAKNSNLYDEFMRNNADKNTDSIKQKKIIFIQGVTKDKLPVVYFIAKRMDNTIDMELLLLHILRTLQEIHNKPFVLVIDCSFFGPEHQIALPWFVKFIRHFPDSAGENLRQVYLLNPNHWFKKYSKRIGKHVGRMQKKITFLTNVLKLSEFIVEPEAALPASTMAVENDVKATFTQVHKLSTHHGMKEVILRINSDLLQLSTIKLHPMLGKTTVLIDLHHIATFQEVSHSSQDHEFVVKYDENGGQKSMTLRSTSSQQIIQALKAAKTRWNLTKPASASARPFRPSDIPGTLLNVALLNLGSTRSTLRVAAYNMLASLCKNSNFSIKMYLLDAPGLCIPKNSSAFVVRVSEKLARTEIHLTLEFLLECLHGITKQNANAAATKSLVLDYMQPWLPNLALFCQKSTDAPEKYTKVVEVLNSLIELTIRETNLKMNVLASVWRPIGKVDNPELVSLAVKCCLKQSIVSGLGSMRSDIIGEIVYTMSAENSQLVGGKVVASVLKGLTQTGQKPTSDLSESDVFPKLSVLLRLLLVLAFDDMISVQQYLPELFHIVLMLFATGSAPVRASSHGLLVNIVHSLYTSMVTPDNKLQSLHFHLADFGQLSFRLLFGIGGSNVAAFSAPDPTHAKELEKMSIMNVDVVAAAMLGVLNSCSPAYGNAVFTAWHSRWMALTTATALANNPALQARAFIVLGVLCRSSDLVTDDLMDQVLATLKNVCANPKSLQDNNDLLVGIIACLTRLYRYLPSTSKYSKSMFWIGMTIVQIYEPRVFTAGIALLETIITVLDSNDAFKDTGLAKTLLASRTTIQAPLARLDGVTGINFESNFSFAVACHLLKGLRHPSTKTTTARLLTTFLGITAKRGVGSEVLGYLTALLPTEGIPANLDQLIPISGDGAKSVFQYLFSESMIPDVDHGALVFTLLATILQNTDREHEQLFIYETLREGISYMPSAFPVTYKTLIPKMSTVISSGQNDKIVETALEIMESMFSFSMESALNKNRLNISHLKKLGFHGIPECGLGFNRGLNQLNEAIMKIITEAIGTVLPPKATPR